MKSKKLNLGCGRYPKTSNEKEEWINLDWGKFKGVDKVHDLNKFPYPFKDNEFDEVYCSHVIEHLDDVIKTINELWRITKNNGQLIIKVPHFSIYNSLSEISHKRCFGWQSFDPFAREDFLGPNYGKARFKIIKKKINFSRGSFLKIFNLPINFLINKILLFKFNFYERFFCYILPSEEIIYILKVVK